MKAVVFTSSLRIGGAESLSVALANALAVEGLDVHLASAGGPLRKNLDARVTYHHTDNPNHLPMRVAHHLSLMFREIRADVVHSHGGSCAMVASVARKASNVPCARVLTHHSRIFRRAPRWIAGPIMARSADHYIAISHDKQRDLESMGIAHDRISLIPNFVDVASVATRVAGIDRARVRRDLGVPEHARVLAMAGRLVRTKRFDTFVRIASTTARRLPSQEVHALVVGDGPELEDVRRIARLEGAPATIHFLGYQRDIFPSLAICDVVVFPSEHPEVLPMFLIEASAAGKTIVCSDIPGNREVVTDHETGRVIRGDVAAFAEAVRDLLQDDGAARRLAAAAQSNARKHFDQHTVARETIQVYEHLLAGREPKG